LPEDEQNLSVGEFAENANVIFFSFNV
jgi:hypothetical protein